MTYPIADSGIISPIISRAIKTTDRTNIKMLDPTPIVIPSAIGKAVPVTFEFLTMSLSPFASAYETRDKKRTRADRSGSSFD